MDYNNTEKFKIIPPVSGKLFENIFGNILDKIKGEDIMLIGLILLFLNLKEEDNKTMVFALLYIFMG